MNRRATAAFRRLLERMLRSVVKVEGSRGIKSKAASGIVLDKKGHVLTAWHAISDQGLTYYIRQAQIRGKEFRIRFSKTAYLADRVYFDRFKDIAVVKLRHQPKDLVPAKIGDSSRLKIGSPLFQLSLGEPHFDSGHLIGFFRKLDEKKEMIAPYFEVSLFAPHGASGGPFFNKKGQVLGIEWGGDPEENYMNPPKEIALEINVVKEWLRRQIDSPALQEIFKDID